MPVKKSGTLSRRERKILLRIILLAVIVASGWVVFAPGSGLYHYHRLQGEIQRLAAKNDELQARNRELSREIDRLQHDDAYIENLARQKYGMLKKNEMVYRFREPKKKEKR